MKNWAFLAFAALLSRYLQARPPHPDMSAVEQLPEQKLIYHPTRGRTLDPGSLGLGIKDLYFAAEDKVRLNAWWLPAPPGAPTVLYFHGNGGSLSGMQPTLTYFHRAGFGALLVDYRGYGLSQGYPSEAGLQKDARAAYQQCLKRGVKPQQLLIHGQSLGGAVAVQLASEKPCAGLILESTFTSAKDMARRLYGGVAAATLHTHYCSVTTVASLKVPVLVMHGDQDSMIPASMGRALFAAAPQPKEFWMVKGADHNNLRVLAGPEYVERLRRFYARAKASAFSRSSSRFTSSQ
ncbi:alpha/beta hydrolase [bacterium]|nr:alpha/beta hydrolase [bacterium]